MGVSQIIKKYFLFIFLLLLIVSLTGCSSEENLTNNTVVEVDEQSNKLSIEEIKSNYNESEIKEITSQGAYVLVEVQKGENYPSEFDLYNIKTGEKIPLIAGRYVELLSMDLKDDYSKSITFLATGKNRAEPSISFPYVIKFVSNKSGFVQISDACYLPLELEAAVGAKSDEIISNVKVTMNGVQVAFKPVPGTEANFYAGSIEAPLTQSSYKAQENKMVLEFKGTQVEDEFLTKQLDTQEHPYIKFVEFKELASGNSTMIIGLTEEARYYLISDERIYNGLPYLNIEFDKRPTLTKELPEELKLRY